jgi:cytochrome c oxidase subunit 2
MDGTTTGAVNEGLYYIAAFSFLLFFGIVFLMVLFAVRYRKSRNPVATEIPGKPWVEVLAFVLPTLLALSMFAYGLTGYQFLRRVPAGAYEVTVRARQWSWSFEYVDGKETPDLVVPAGRDVRLTIISDDVIHGFYVPALRIQEDAVPGMKTGAWFKARDVGSYDILCTVYCGTNHSAMMAKLYVLPPDRFAAWEKGEQVELAGASLPLVKPTGLDLLRARGCLSCHSTEGGPGVGPTFKGLFGSRQTVITAGAKREIVADAEYIRLSILEPHADLVSGFKDIMPAGVDPVDMEELEEEVEAIAALK